ncbi:SGNH/GDSL hydrolase family protein [Devosia sp. CAU 1758]
MTRFLFVFLAGLVFLGPAAPVLAQSVSADRMELAQAEQPRRRTLFDLLFGDEPAPAPQVQQTQPRPQAKPAAAPPPPAAPTVDKAPDATRLAVFGDSMAIDLTKALERFYAEDPNLVVIGQGVSSSGFVRDDFFDWNAAIAEQIAADTFDIAVITIGINDRQEISAGGQTYEALSEGWSTAYQARLNTFLGQLRAARKPVVWMGLPPMSRSQYSAAMTQITALHRLAAFSGGAEFVDIYDRFADAEGKYTAYGPDVNGQNALMRKDDGIHYSAAGSDKLAFYISQSIRNFYRGGRVSVAVVDPLQGTDAATMLRPPHQGLGQIRLLEVAGAVMPLSRAPDRASGLVLANGVPEAPAAFPLDQLVQAPMGRVDAFGVGVTADEETPEEAAAAQ